MEKRICKDCGKEFALSDGEIKFFKEKGLHLPKRCSECRKKKNGAQQETISNFHKSNDTGKSYIPTFVAVPIIIVCIIAAVFICNTKIFVSDEKNIESITSVTETAVLYQTETTAGDMSGYITEEEETAKQIIPETTEAPPSQTVAYTETEYKFRTEERRREHYEKHGKDMGFSSEEEYEKAASDVIKNPASLHKTEKEDGDDVYYLESENAFVVKSTEGYIRTFYYPENGMEYFKMQ